MDKKEWTTTHPDKTGWYWWRSADGFFEQVVYVDKIDGTLELTFTGDAGIYDAEVYGGEWKPVY